MTGKADQLHVLSHQHVIVRRSMRLMTGRTCLKPHRGMLEREWTALIAVATQASGFVRSEHPGHRGTHAAVRIVAIGAAHFALGNLVPERFLKLGPGV